MSDPRRPTTTSGVRLLVEGLEVTGQHGVSAGERSRGARLRIDIEMEGAFSAAAHSDDLSETVDLAAVAETARDVNQSRSFHLIESLADAIAASVLMRFPRVESVTVHVRKIHPQGLQDAECSGAEVRRWR